MKAKILTFTLTLLSICSWAQDSGSEKSRESESSTETSKYQLINPDTAEYHLTADEKKALEIGPISSGKYVGGAIAGTLVGFGLGNAIQGRYDWRGTTFTVGELASLGVITVAAINCMVKITGEATSAVFGGDVDDNACQSEMIAINISTIVFFGLKVWEIADNWAVPPMINSDYRRAKAKMEGRRSHFMILPDPQNNGLAFNYVLRF